MKTKTRILSAALLAAALLASVSCGAQTGIEEDDESETAPVTEAMTEAPTEEDLHPLPEKDMDGYQMRFYSYNDVWITWANMMLDCEEETGDNLEDEIYRRNRRIEDQYNCEIVTTLVDDTKTKFNSLMMAGDDLYDITMVYDENVAQFYSSGLIQSWDVLPYVDTSLSWWNQNANKVFSLHGKQFAAVGDFYLGMASRGFVLCFNKDHAAQLDLDENLYDMVRNNHWTLDTYASVIKDFSRDLDGNGEWDNSDQYVSAGAIKLYYGSLVTGCGVTYIDVDKDGNPYFAIPGNDRTMDVFEKIFSIHDGTNIFRTVYKTDVHGGSNESRPLFENGQLLFYGTATNSISTKLRACPFDIGILPFPKYDEQQENFYILTSGTGVATIPITLPAEKNENVGILMEALSRDSHKGLIPTYREVVLKSKYARDEDSADMLDIIFASGIFDLGLSVWPNESYYKYMESYLKMNNNFASLTETLAPKVEAKIAELLEALDNAE